jgi:hypothetical protein
MESPSTNVAGGHPTLSKVVFLNIIFKFIRPSVTNIDGLNSLRRFFELAWVHESWRETVFVFPGPQTLFLNNTKNIKVKYALLQHIANFVSLKELDLFDTDAPDEGLQLLNNLSSNMVKLNLGYTKISNAGLQFIQNFVHLEILQLYNTAITNEGVKHLSNLPALEELWLSYNDVSDECLQYLVKLPRLVPERFFSHATQITKKGLANFKAELLERQNAK